MPCDLKTENISAQTKLRAPSEEVIEKLKEIFNDEIEILELLELINNSANNGVFTLTRCGQTDVRITLSEAYRFSNPDIREYYLNINAVNPYRYVEIVHSELPHITIKGTFIYAYINKEVYFSDVYVNKTFIPSKLLVYSF